MTCLFLNVNTAGGPYCETSYYQTLLKHMNNMTTIELHLLSPTYILYRTLSVSPTRNPSHLNRPG